jgi:hypothetical protein
VGEGRRRRRVGQVVGRHEHGLHGGDGALLGRGNALLQRPHFLLQVRLVTHGAGRRPSRADTSEPAWVKRKMLSMNSSTSLALVAETFGDGQAGQADAQTGARRFVHLAKHQAVLSSTPDSSISW